MIRYLSIAVLLAAAAGSGTAQTQNSDTIPGTKVRTVAPEQDLPTDPRLAGEGKLPPQVKVFPVGAMTPEDKDLAASAAAAIRAGAALEELGFEEGDWQQNQLVCPAFPQHVFLRFTRNLGSGDVSMFSVSFLRSKASRVRVIPILRRGFSPISQAPESKATMGTFNRIQAEEHGARGDWTAASVCYAALTSARWKEPEEEVTLGLLGSQTLVLGSHGELSVALELPDPASGRWVVSYDRAGDVTKTEYTPFGDLRWRRLPAPAVEAHGKPVPAPRAEEKGRVLPTGPEPVGKPIPAPTDLPTKPQ